MRLQGCTNTGQKSCCQIAAGITRTVAAELVAIILLLKQHSPPAQGSQRNPQGKIGPRQPQNLKWKDWKLLISVNETLLASDLSCTGYSYTTGFSPLSPLTFTTVQPKPPTSPINRGLYPLKPKATSEPLKYYEQEIF